MISIRKNLRVYADTSVFGGVFDEEFKKPSRAFFEAVRQGRFKLVTSEVVYEEIREGPKSVQEVFQDFLGVAEIADITSEAMDLQKAYIDAGIVSLRYATDALHVALATLAQASLIVSWNFKHIVNFKKIPMYNAVNTLHGHGYVAIHSPLEVVEYED
jgi:predicted nucleic acid-binding protein